MSPELDKTLCKAYPKLFCDRYASISQSCMAFGLEVGDGWYNIVKVLCMNIQSHINQSRIERAYTLRYNRALRKSMKSKTTTELVRFYNARTDNTVSSWTIKAAQEDLEKAEFKSIYDACNQVVITQVKEKFGTLRFYYSGGDSVIDGMVRMAESMSAVTCEQCGAPGKLRGNGWMYTACDTHTRSD